MSKPFRIKATLFWAYLDKPNDMSGKYQVDLCQLSPAAVERLTELGVSVANKDDDRGDYVTAKSQQPIFSYDTNGERITEVIGNGSKAEPVVDTFSWTFKNKEGVSVSLKKLVITDLEIYESVPDFDDDLEEAL